MKKEEKLNFKKSCEFYCKYHKVGKLETTMICGNLGMVVERLLKSQRKEIIEEMIKLFDDTELKISTSDINEWRAFKLFRNKMRENLIKEDENIPNN